jgi:predicted CXXCH cytochrome family protein
MARTWQGVLPPNYKEDRTEGPAPAITYHATRTQFETILAGRAPVKGTVEAILGGERHGVSFLMRLRSLEGAQLARAPLVEARYLHSTHENALVLSPGFPEEKPTTYESALGRVLSPSFEKKCLDCHGRTDSGVRCESCHGPGKAHLEAVAAGKPHTGFGKAAESCAQCHSGFSVLYDPLPDDLLISNQVNALKNSECFVQSEGRIRCTSCHDPHEDSPRVAAKSIETCVGCHSARVERHAALCPVNREGGCVGCHMPGVTKGSFTMVDHWIRVHPGPKRDHIQATSKVRPRRVYLRIIVTDDSAKAAQAHQRLEKGEPFFEVARDVSLDPSAAGGGYLGEMWLDQMEIKLADAVASLAPGDFSPVIDAGSRHIIFQRMPRDFREQADRLQQQASALRVKGRLAEAVDKYTEALRVYPQFLRALIFLGATYGQQGNGERALGILEFGARLYPDDPAAQYNLGIAYGALGRTADEIRAYRRAIEIEPDLLPAYQNLGAALYSTGQTVSAIDAYRRGLDVNPLSAVLYRNLGVVTDSDAPAAIARKIEGH